MQYVTAEVQPHIPQSANDKKRKKKKGWQDESLIRDQQKRTKNRIIILKNDLFEKHQKKL